MLSLENYMDIVNVNVEDFNKYVNLNYGGHKVPRGAM